MRILDPIVLQSPALLPAAIGAIAFQKKAAVYDLMFRTAAETLTTIAAHPKHLGARIGLTAVLHTWGSAPTHHPHVHIIAPGGGMSPDSSRWQSRKRISWSLRRGAQWATTASSQLVARAYVGSHLGLRISNFASKKPSNLRISTKNILTFDGLVLPLELLAGLSGIGVRTPFAPVGSSHPEQH
jgi:Putative transposase